MQLQHKWEIDISAGAYYQSLAQDFCGEDIHLSVLDEDHLGVHYLAYSYHIDDMSCETEISSRLFTLQVLLNGCLRAHWNKCFFTPLEFISFRKIEGAGGMGVSASQIESYPFSKNPSIDANQSRWNPASKLFSSYLLLLSKNDDVLRALLIQIGLISFNGAFEKIMTWSTLYKIYDSVRYHSGENSYPIDKFADKKRLNAFTAACNNSLVIGANARHGDMGWRAPKVAITDIEEASSLILEFSRSFIIHYVKDKYPIL